MPLAFLFNGVVPWRLIGIICGAALLAIIYLKISQISRLEDQLRIISQTANDNAVLARLAQQSVDRANQIAAQVDLDAQAYRKRLSTMHKAIADAPPSDDGLVAPVLRRALDGLPRQDRDKNGAGTFSSPTG